MTGSSNETKKTKTAAKTVQQKKGPKIYIGPSLLPMIKYTVLADETPLHVQDLIGKCPAVAKLIVNIKDIAEKESRIAKKGTLEHRYYQDVIDFANQARKERRGDK